MRPVQSFFVLVCVALLSACGLQISAKQGAGSDDFTAADRKCRANGTYDAYEKCMTQAGWTVHKMDDHNPLMVAVPDASNQSGSASFVPAKSVKPIPKDEKGNPLPPDPLTPFNVSSWWKMGGTPEELKIATADCAAKLGPTHQPAANSMIYTRSMILCLKEKGWYGLQGY